MNKTVKIQDLIGRTFVAVAAHDGGNTMSLTEPDGGRFVFYHIKECCEDVEIVDICGDLNDLVGMPIVLAEEVTQNTADRWNDVSETWTFYKFATIKGSVTVRWLGRSNGYYSEAVDLIHLADDEHVDFGGGDV